MATAKVVGIAAAPLEAAVDQVCRQVNHEASSPVELVHCAPALGGGAAVQVPLRRAAAGAAGALASAQPHLPTQAQCDARALQTRRRRSARRRHVPRLLGARRGGRAAAAAACWSKRRPRARPAHRARGASDRGWPAPRSVRPRPRHEGRQRLEAGGAAARRAGAPGPPALLLTQSDIGPIAMAFWRRQRLSDQELPRVRPHGGGGGGARCERLVGGGGAERAGAGAAGGS
mmetsp:Transcript_29558/g.94420  ORF Transcript_29558/g.94420 Transcript_29558/m.94420 type:complete len:231 (-) Transcript_29558:282-974(-)